MISGAVLNVTLSPPDIDMYTPTTLPGNPSLALPGSETRVSSWGELIEQLHSRDMVQRRPSEGDHLRSPYVFRGVDDASWGLTTSLQRVPRNDKADPRIIEQSLVRNFRKYASAGAYDD